MSAAIRLIVIAAFCSSQFSCDAFSPDRTQGLVRAIFKNDVTNVVCPGGRSQCPDDSTCCPLSSGQYGCCPVPNAVCCSDKIHCCPGGYTCDTSQGTCIKGNSQISWLEKSVATDIANVVCPGGQSQCPDGTTCCPLSSGGYGCCPLPNAVCCSDKIHCCPSGYTCETSQGTCIKGNSQIPWLEKSLSTDIANVVCPGGQSECPDGTTCCPLSSGQYGCCPIPNAVCCSDKVHCCPSGYTCDTSQGTCIKGDSQISWLEKSVARDIANVVCPGGRSECPSGTTCCPLSSGQYGCCPIPNAVCCSDKVHCCPSGYTCDTSQGTCIKGDSQISWLEKSVATGNDCYSDIANVVCPGGRSECPSGTTCCPLSSGQYGCCPIPNAVCCSDKVHCCPSGYTCDTSQGTCIKGDSQISWLEKSVATGNDCYSDIANVVCPGGRSECPSGTTCCPLSSGQYGCCPIPNAVCCSDKVHCCPSGYTCDTSQGTCIKGDSQISWLEKSVATDIANVVCPGGRSQCPDGTTCCPMSSGGYGCCPLPNAVCCSDKIHCCPSGYTCNTSQGTCIKGNSQISWLEKSVATDIANVVCPGGRSECPSGTTCCPLSSGQYGCCPIPNAVCCSDKIHCCPSGYTCDTSQGTCIKGGSQISWLEKSVATDIANVVCPGGQSQCPDGTTCCPLSSGGYGCCPLPNAVCCSDKIHCCPSGYTCDTSQGTCIKGNSQISWLEKSVATDIANVVCPGGQSQCPDGTTCCPLSSGGYGCCPLPNAVCCSDKIHCCPSGYTCDTSQGTCIKGNSQITWFEKSVATDIANVVCPGGQSQCPDGTTCCPLSSGGYGCCPLPNAVCCSDKVHCCPSGYTCETSQGTCVKGNSQIPWLEKSVATDIANVVCPDGRSECPGGTTCCPLSSGGYGCCPLPNAVCCSDKIHCCPSGYTCGNGACFKGNSQIPWLEKSSATDIANVVCPGGQSQCPDGTTCCPLSSGGYGCCPLPNAVCCSDKIHCCPSGYTCDTSQGTCIKGNSQISWLENSAATDIANVVCPGGQSQCPDGTTCCPMSSGGYGCCPLPNAVCCSDKIHCCPSGYTCDTSQGTCIKGNSQISWLEKSVATDIANVVCPGGQSQCPDGTTCCPLSSGGYGCCPLPNAVCCSDKIHCCPSGYTCDTSQGTCIKGNSQISWLEKSVATVLGNDLTNPSTDSSNVANRCVFCPDDTECPEFNTCCQLPNLKYGCCGFPHAVCCSDHTHCCRHGEICDVEHGLCRNAVEHSQHPMLQMAVFEERSFASKSDEMSFDEM